MNNQLVEDLHASGQLTDQEVKTIRTFESEKPFSLHWELKSLLYLGVVLLNIGLGILIYQNINTFGHAILVAVIGLLSLACFGYCWRHRQPFSRGYTDSPTPYFDYVLMLGCFTLLICEGYLQYQYQVFGTRYGLATLIPTIVFFITAYRFDHRGVLGLALTGLAAWMGISVTPKDLLRNNDFDSPTLIYTAVLLGVILILTGLLSEQRNIKRHFTLSYLHFSIHLYHIAALCGLFTLEPVLLWIAVLAAGVAFFIWYARTNGTFYFLLMALLYGYIGCTYVAFRYLFSGVDELAYYLYFMASGIGLIWFLLNRKKVVARE